MRAPSSGLSSVTGTTIGIASPGFPWDGQEPVWLGTGASPGMSRMATQSVKNRASGT